MRFQKVPSAIPAIAFRPLFSNNIFRMIILFS